MTFEDALEASAGATRRHLLLGNGFSIACEPDSFTYGRLFDEADLSGLSVDERKLFALTSTTDFERVIEMLRSSAAVVDLYGSEDKGLVESLREDADRVKESLAEVLARKHPDHVHSISSDKYAAARRFLAEFNGNLYSVNYDLLLYWTLIQDGLEPEVETDDGFRADPDDPDADYVIWDAYANYSQRVYFLHGGLHLFDSGSQLHKLTFARTGIHLVDQIRDALDRGAYPRVVTEGASDEKLRAVLHSAYLAKGLRSLTSCSSVLFIYGHALADNDDHILRCITNGKVKSLYVSVYGDPASATNQAIRLRAEGLAAQRPRSKPLAVEFYDAGSAEVWG